MRPLALGTAAWCLAVSGAPAHGDEELRVGDRAPPLAVQKFLKGEPIAELETGRPYVVVFWATWSSLSRISMPYLSDLQKKYPEVPFIAVSIWEQEPAAVEPFVKEMGERIAFRVAVDAVPEGADRSHGRMARAWMQAAGQSRLPTVFVMDAGGRIAWVGHPMSLGKALAEIVASRWDPKAAAAAFEQDQARKLKRIDVADRVARARRMGNVREAVKFIDQAIADNPESERTLGPQKYFALASRNGDPDAARAYGKRLVETVLSQDGNALNNFAWSLVDPAGPPAGPAAAQLALEAALRADQLSGGRSSYIADTLAKAYFDNCEVAKALELQERAMRLAVGTPFERDEGMAQRLELYRKAARK